MRLIKCGISRAKVTKLTSVNHLSFNHILFALRQKQKVLQYVTRRNVNDGVYEFNGVSDFCPRMIYNLRVTDLSYIVIQKVN